MTEVIVSCRDWSPERKRKKPNEKDFYQEPMEVDVTSLIGEDFIADLEDKMIVEEFVEMYLRQSEGMDVSVGSGSLHMGKGCKRCFCGRKAFRRLCRKRKRRDY